MSCLRLTLPYPPSANRQWRSPGGRVKLSQAARDYRQNVYAAVIDQGARPLSGRLVFSVTGYPPDKRQDRDLDNVAFKAVLDALEAAGVIPDDSQVKELHAYWGDLDHPHGRLEVELTPLDE